MIIEEDEDDPGCPDCGARLIDCACGYTAGDLDDEYDGVETQCADCGRVACDTCICGAPLCHMCFETGAGFCKDFGDDEHLALCQEMM